MKLQKYIHKSVAQRLEIPNISAAYLNTSTPKFTLRNNHKKFCSIEGLLHTFFHTIYKIYLWIWKTHLDSVG